MFVGFVVKTMAVRVIYAELLVVSRTRVRPRVLWQDKLGRTIPWSKVYVHSYRGFSMNQEQDVFFKVFHHVLKMGEYFSSSNCLHFCLDCSFFPGQLDTLDHLFLSCPFARGVWSWAAPFFCKVLGVANFVPSPQTLLGLDFVESFPWRPRDWQFIFSS